MPITVKEKAGPRTIANDEHPLKVDPAKIPGLKPAFRANGTITPAASSANADGAAALILAKRSLADRDGLPMLAEIKGHATHSQEPQWFTTAPIPAIRKLLDKVGWSVGDVDLFEINEAFAVVAMAAQRDLGIPRDKLNINGGACALGHPIGATGARLIVTLLHALEAQNLKRGVAALLHRRRRSHRDRRGTHRALSAPAKVFAPGIACRNWISDRHGRFIAEDRYDRSHRSPAPTCRKFAGNFMISNWLSAALARRNIHYGWVMVGVTFFTALITAGTVGAPGVFIVPLQHEFGWTTAEISSALSIRFILFGLMAPFAAALLNRYGLRNVTLSALLIVASALVTSLGMTKVWQLMLLWGVVIGIGTGMTALVLGATIAARWFAARRGLVVGILTASVATGQLVFLPLLASITERVGWRIALGLMCVMLAVAAFAVLMLMRDRPSDVGLRPFGDEGTEPLPAPPASNAPIMAAALGTLRDASKQRVFWILFATFFICGASTNGLVQVHLIPMCLDFGIPQVQAASLLAAMGVFDFFGTIMSGWLSDRYDNRWLLFWYYGLRGLSLLFLPFSDFSFYGLSLFAMFYGLDWIATVPPTVRLTAQRFGPERANLVFGWIFAGHQMGAATAAFGAGLSRTLLATYLPAFFVAGALCVVAALIVLAIARPPKPVAA